MNRVVDEDVEHILSTPLPWDRLNGKTVLVTGAGGMIGGYCTKVAESITRTVTMNRTELFETWKHLRADFIIHTASPASPRAYCADPMGTIRANTVGTENMLNIAKRSNSESFLFLSSGEVYGKGAPTPCPETFSGPLDAANPRNVYASAKRRGESLCFRRADVNVKIARISHTYGPGMNLDDGRVFADFVSDIVNKRDIVLKSDGLACRPFCYLSDLVIGLFTILLKGERDQAYNVGAEEETRIADLAETLCKMFPPRSVVWHLRAQADAYVASTVSGGHLDITKIRALGWEPTTGIEEGFRRTVESYG